jgi:hypothetical protein
MTKGKNITAVYEWVRGLPIAPEEDFSFGDGMPGSDTQVGKGIFFREDQDRVEWWDGGRCCRWESIPFIAARWPLSKDL